jgi:hypothetical protein
MNQSARRALRAGIGVAGLAALGASLTGTAYAATDDHVSAGRSEAADPGSTLGGDRTGSAEPAMHSFELPGSTSSGMPGATSIPVSNHSDSDDSDDDDSDSDSGDSAPDESDAYDEEPNHDGSDVNDRDESGGEGEGGGYPRCEQHHSANDYGAQYNGDKSDDDSYDSDDYDPDCTGFHGENKNNGYNGYTGTDQGRQDSNHYRFAPV